MNKITVLKYGTVVRLVRPDMLGFCGREDHPQKSDVGFLGVVVANQVDAFDADGFLLYTRRNLLGGIEVVDDEEYGNGDVCYTVRGADGRLLDLMNHEIEVV